MTTKENQIEQSLIDKLKDLKYTYREDIRDKAALEQNFRQKFEALNRVNLTDAEFARLRDETITVDVFTAAQKLREKNLFLREDGTPLEFTLVNIKDWCKNDFEVINQLCINTDNSHHRYDVILLINGVPVVQIELKTLRTSPRRAMEQIVDYKNDPMATRCSVLCSCLLSATKKTPATSPTTPTNISALMRKNAFYRSTSMPTKTITKSSTCMILPTTSSPNAPWAN